MVCYTLNETISGEMVERKANKKIKCIHEISFGFLFNWILFAEKSKLIRYKSNRIFQQKHPKKLKINPFYVAEYMKSISHKNYVI